MAEPVALVSVHDVMPDTIPLVQRLVQQLDEQDIAPLTLLVVPGGAWTDSQLAWLRSRQDRGDQLAGHGWVHHAGAVNGLYDWLHRRLFSRGVAEHLPLDGDEIAGLITRCHEWFAAHKFDPPQLYVPPAWAMGSISRSRLRELPFNKYETLTGVYDARADRFEYIALLGYEADTGLRAVLLRALNGINRMIAAMRGQVRVSIHPHDLQLHLRNDLSRAMSRLQDCSEY